MIIHGDDVIPKQMDISTERIKEIVYIEKMNTIVHLFLLYLRLNKNII